MKTIDDVIEQCEEIANASKQHTLHMTHFSQSYDEWAEEWIQLAEWLKELKAYRENTCGDAISRQVVLDATVKRNSIWNMITNSKGENLEEIISQLPSVTPQQRTGEWIAQDIHNCHTDFKCSACGYIHSFMHLYGKLTADYTYCPKCGCKMREVEG